MDDWTLEDAARLTISCEEFRKAWDVAEGVGSGQVVSLKHPSERGTVSITDGDEVIEVGFTDTPYVRTMFAIRDLFGRGNPNWMACHLRLDAVYDLFSDSRMQRWLRDVDGSARIFEGVLDAAATVPLHWDPDEEEGGWSFNPDEFFPVVEAINASGKYSHTGEVW